MPMNQVRTATLVKYNTGSQGSELGHVSKAILPKSSVKVLRTTMSVYLPEEVSKTLLLPRPVKRER
jgi:hypothetical protein